MVTDRVQKETGWSKLNAQLEAEREVQMALVEEAAVITTTQEALDSGITDIEAAQKYGEDVVLDVKKEIMNEKPELLQPQLNESQQPREEPQPEPELPDEPERLVGDMKDIASESRLDEEADLNDSIDVKHLDDIIAETRPDASAEDNSSEEE